MAKRKTEFHKDPLLLILLAVVFSAAAIIFLRSGGLDGQNPTAGSEEVLGVHSPERLMQELESTDIQFDGGEFDQLKEQIKGL